MYGRDVYEEEVPSVGFDVEIVHGVKDEVDGLFTFVVVFSTRYSQRKSESEMQTLESRDRSYPQSLMPNQSTAK